MTSTIATTREARALKQAARRAARKQEQLEVSTGCGCGCGQAVTRRYAPGHDAKHKSALLAIFDSGTGLTDEQAALLEGFGYSAERLQERHEADVADAAAAEAKLAAKRAKQLATQQAKAEKAKTRAAEQAAKAKQAERKVAALEREQANQK